jgi:hypothetical protein
MSEMTKESLMKLPISDLAVMILGLTETLSNKLGGTPAAEWREKGEKDPFGDRFNGDRSKLCYGHLTDDQMANAVYLNPGIANLTGAKDRIRWLSRMLVEANAINLNQLKANAITDFIGIMIGAFESGFTDTSTLNLQQLHRFSQHHIKDEYDIEIKNIVDEWGREFAEECGLPKAVVPSPEKLG